MSLSVPEQSSSSAASAEEFSRAYAAGEEDAAIQVAVAALESEASFVPPFESVWWLCGELIARRRYRLGLNLTEQAWKQGYRGWRSLYLRGIFLALNREIEPAAEMLGTARKAAPADKRREIVLLEARVRALAGQGAAALRLFRGNLSFDTADAGPIAAALRVAHREGARDLVIAWAAAANKAQGPTVSRMRLLAEIHYEKGDWRKARNAADGGLRIAPENLAFGRIAARSVYREGRIVQAIARLEAQLAQDPDWSEGKVLLCRCLLAGGRSQEARRILKTIPSGDECEEERREILARLPDVAEDDASADQFVDGAAKPRKRKKNLEARQDSEVMKIMSSVPDVFSPRWTAETLAARGNPLVAIRRMSHSVRTLMLREVMARFGRHELGYLWAILEPAMHVLVISVIFYFIRARDTLGMNVVLFVTTGVVPLFVYLKTYNHLTNALRQNRPLLNHARVQPMDIFFARGILEFLTHIFVLILFVSVIYVFVDRFAFGSALSVLANLFGLWIVGIGAGLALGSLSVFIESIKNVMDGLNRLIYITSGVFFTLDMMPSSVAKYMAYNPLLHFVDGVRGNFNPLMGGSRVDIAYGFSWAAAILFFGLLADRALRRRVLDR